MKLPATTIACRIALKISDKPASLTREYHKYRETMAKARNCFSLKLLANPLSYRLPQAVEKLSSAYEHRFERDNNE